MATTSTGSMSSATALATEATTILAMVITTGSSSSVTTLAIAAATITTSRKST